MAGSGKQIIQIILSRFQLSQFETSTSASLPPDQLLGSLRGHLKFEEQMQFVSRIFLTCISIGSWIKSDISWFDWLSFLRAIENCSVYIYFQWTWSVGSNCLREKKAIRKIPRFTPLASIFMVCLILGNHEQWTV